MNPDDRRDPPTTYLTRIRELAGAALAGGLFVAILGILGR